MEDILEQLKGRGIYGRFAHIPLYSRPVHECKSCSQLELGKLLTGSVANMTNPVVFWRRSELQRLCDFGLFLAARLPARPNKATSPECEGTCLGDIIPRK